MKKTELQTLVVNELKALAKKMKVKLPGGARKADIVDTLAAAFKKNSKPVAIKNSAVKNDVKNGSAVRNAVAVKKAPASRTPTARRKTKPQASPKPAVRKPQVETPPTGREWKMPPGAEEPIMAQERVADAKYYTGPDADTKLSAAPYQELPLGYGEERIALMVRDPNLAYTYWELTPSRIERERSWFGWNAKLAVRIYDVTGVQFDGRNAIGYIDQEVEEQVGSWYFDLGRPNHSFIADIGLLSPDGRYLTLARSNYVMMPRNGVSDIVDEEWLLLDEEFWKLYGFPGGPSSPQLQEMMKNRRSLQITSPGMFRDRIKK